MGTLLWTIIFFPKGKATACLYNMMFSKFVLYVLLSTILFFDVSLSSFEKSNNFDRIMDDYVSTLKSTELTWHSGNESTFCASLILPNQINDTRFQCTSLVIPFDYSNPSTGIGNLSILRFRPNEEVENTLFINLGGPGALGSSFLRSNVKFFESLTKGKYEIIGWDPRGMGTSGPSPAQCYKDYDEANKELEKYYVQIPPIKTLNDEQRQSILQQLIKSYNHIPINENCSKYSTKEALELSKYLNSFNNALDLEFMRRNINPDQPLNYYGLSYGTIFGSYYVTMFPNRTGKMIFDGIVDVNHYLTHTWLENIGSGGFGDAEELLTYFYEKCIQVGKEKCELASQIGDVNELKSLVDKALMKLYNDPMKISSQNNFTIKISDFEKFIYGALFLPCLQSSFERLGLGFNFLIEGKVDDLYNLLFIKSIQIPLTTSFKLAEIQASRSDGARDENIQPKDVLRFIEKDGLPIAPHLISSIETSLAFTGSRGYPKVQRSSLKQVGLTNVTLSTPILLIGNYLDPITPFRNVIKLSKEFGQASTFIFQHPGIGHTTLAQPSNCTFNVMTDYLFKGILPKFDGTDCQSDLLPLFGPDTPFIFN